jgi:uncharacterized 2Fe-2S/4Fe-4S cluster protein (DUF4445 family)
VPILTIKFSDKYRHIAFMAGRSVRDILDETDIRVRAGCNGEGACGLCRIRIVGGNGGEPSQNEELSLDAGMLSQGVRLACQVQAEHDLQIEIISLAPRSPWRRLEEGWAEDFSKSKVQLVAQDSVHPLGVAIDLGTTHISITMLDLVTGYRLAGRSGLNPQSCEGTDVMTRVMSAETRGQAAKLGSHAVNAIGDGLYDIGSREGIDLKRVSCVVIVGNTAMLALLSGRNYHLLLQPRYWDQAIECCPIETTSWASAWGINPKAAVEVIPPVAGFIGSDLLAGIMATRLTECGPGALLIDFGTNSEVALWDGNTIWVTSAAGGPAFEGCGMSFGMPADPGAIFRIHELNGQCGISFEVVGGVEPRGLCGTGMVDLLACLIRDGTLNDKGQFAQKVSASGFPLHFEGCTMFLTKKDVDTFQRAKAAIGVAVNVLLKKAGISYNELKRIFIGGVFGQYLNVHNAMEIGLLPSVLSRIIETSGNTALAGCEAALLSSERKDHLQAVLKKAVIINLSAFADFESLFLEHLYLMPIDGNRGHDGTVF